MEFQKFSFPDIRGTIVSKDLVFSGWMSFHINTEFKARAAIYHFERLFQTYEEYLRVQPFSEDQSVMNLQHPLKEVIFFEFLATITNLSSCFESTLQEINSAYKLKLSATIQRGQKHVNRANVLQELKKRFSQHEIVEKLSKLCEEGTEENEWFTFLREMRNTAIHSDIYTRAYETRNVPETFRRFGELAQETNKKLTVEDVKKTIKRDIVITVNGQDYFMFGIVKLLRDKMLDYVRNLHEIMIGDGKIRGIV